MHSTNGCWAWLRTAKALSRSLMIRCWSIFILLSTRNVKNARSLCETRNSSDRTLQAARQSYDPGRVGIEGRHENDVERTGGGDLCPRNRNRFLLLRNSEKERESIKNLGCDFEGEEHSEDFRSLLFNIQVSKDVMIRGMRPEALVPHMQ